MEEGKSYDVVIIGGGISGLTCGLYLQEAGLKVLILERAPQAGGLTSSWQVQEQGDTEGKSFVLRYLKEDDIVLQYPMHMIFREKYPNFIDVYNHLGILDTNLTPPLKEFNIIDSRLVKHKFKMEDSLLPAPLHSIKTVLGLKMGIIDRLSFLFAGLPIIYLGNSLNCEKPTVSFWDMVSMEALLERAWVTARSRDFVASYVPSIYNLDSIEVNARRMAMVTFGTLFMSKRGLWYQLVNDNYLTGTVEPHVSRFMKAGGTIKLNCEARRIFHNETEVVKIAYQDLNSGRWITCPCCGCKQPVLDEGFCRKCGLRWTFRGSKSPDQVQIEPPAGENLQEVSAKYYVAGVRGHQLVPLMSLESPLRAHPYFQNLGREKGACLSIARIFYDQKITDEKFITGTSRRVFCFNGCQDVGNIMPRYSKYPGSVVDVLADRAESLQLLPVKEFLKQVVRDLSKVWPQAGEAEVKLAIGAHIHPGVLYHKEVPRLPGERNRLVDTPLKNLYACNCSLGLIGIGMESAYQAGKLAANRILAQEDRPTVHVQGFPQYPVTFLTRITFKFVEFIVQARNFLARVLTSF
ncbi:MAG: FAD-dependent oxidoreductase [Deltaproteobacteria bacterium]|jgi:hypothetical protein